jgi:hypothetical protein
MIDGSILNLRLCFTHWKSDNHDRDYGLLSLTVGHTCHIHFLLLFSFCPTSCRFLSVKQSR